MTFLGLEAGLFRSCVDPGGIIGIIRGTNIPKRGTAVAEHIDQTIADLQMLLKQQVDQVRGTKRTINSLLTMAGKEALFSETELIESGQTGSLSNIASDRWYQQPLATAIRDYLSIRKSTGNGPAAVAEIHAALVAGGYEFDAKNDDYAKRGLRSSLTKNPGTFHRLPDGKRFGLTEWYPKVAAKGGVIAADPEPVVDSGDEDSDDAKDQKGRKDE